MTPIHHDVCLTCGKPGAHYVRDGGGPWHKLCIPLRDRQADLMPSPMALRFVRIGDHDLPLPAYETAGAAGMDLRARDGDWIRPGGVRVFPTGWAVELPSGVEGQVRPRSGLAARRGVTVLNAPGTIDSDYRGEVQVILINHGREDYEVQEGDRIAQLVIAPMVRVVPEIATAVTTTDRGAGGLGSTGR